MKLAVMLNTLETQVTHAKLGGFEWLEVSPEILKYFCRGEIPKAGYMIYKDIKLCQPGHAEEISKREGLSTHAIVFKEEAKTMSVGTTIK